MKDQKTIALFGGSFNPPGIHHQDIVRFLSGRFDVVKVIPCGPRPDKAVTNEIKPIHRAVMADLAFNGIAENVEVEVFDLENSTFSRSYDLERSYESEGDVWHVVGTDIIKGGSKGRSDIQTSWYRGKDLWARSKFAVVIRDGHDIEEADLPPNHIRLNVGSSGSSSEIRTTQFTRGSLRGLVDDKIISYINRRGLYRGLPAAEVSEMRFSEVRPQFFIDEKNDRSRNIKKELEHLEDNEDPNAIIVIGGDGTMLHAIKKNWRKRLPFLGINTGHMGFLMNNVKENVSKVFEEGFILRSSPLLLVEASYKDGTSRRAAAFNDAFVHASVGGTGWFEVRVNGEVRIEKLVADGVLAATPAGSTAYARSMGARPVPIGTEVLVVVGSNVYEPADWNKGANLLSDSRISFINKDSSGKRPMQGFADGENIGEIERMDIRLSRIAAPELLFTRDHDLQRKLDSLQFPASNLELKAF